MMHLVCLGHAKCGTTLLDSVFRQSQLVATPAEAKEIKFFLPRVFEKHGARERYLGLFATANGAQGVGVTFEASPPYSHQTPEVLREVLANIVDILEDPRIVLCFRQPVLRAYSHYIHNLHSFALYGEGAFAPRPDLLRKPCTMSFEEALTSTSRLATRYATTLRLACDAVGRDRLLLFFLERDAARLGNWIAQYVGQDVAAELEGAAARSGTVFGRRPIPNYVAYGDSLHAFGSLPGEHVLYADAGPAAVRAALEAKNNWTLSLEPEEVVRLTSAYFQDDLRKCVELTGEPYFLEYLRPPALSETAELSPCSLLRDLHGVEV
ncbi:hypothetical protein FZO89_13170 [Luteimonas viscosa]|uniref:Sulfotransferase family protein n=1 Tax=Luteimonas viscosa TaxID=1132694 RepID=A0A5D4XVQ5_9GAMM|nr:hypothetical protein [Luteimonas viscosa]TYT27132.1 hypothetical protein FZO89_13170 [Luteimonas viscosa]